MMRKTSNTLAATVGALLLGCLAMSQAQAAALISTTGSFTADAQVNLYNLTLTTAQTVNFFTTSYAGGTNLNGTTSAAGGFVPNLTLFSVASGNVVQCEGAGTTCNSTGSMGMPKIDPVTGVADDVNFTETLGAGSYVLALSESPNVAIGGINDGFLTALDSTLFSDACGAGMFHEADLSTCPQRNGTFSVNANAVPEPATAWLALPVLALGMLFRKRLVILTQHS